MSDRKCAVSLSEDLWSLVVQSLENEIAKAGEVVASHPDADDPVRGAAVRRFHVLRFISGQITNQTRPAE